MIYELITVDVIPGKLKEFHDMWLKESLPVWEEHGIKHIGSWETTIGKSNEVIRLFAFEDLAHYERWMQFLAQDEDGKELRGKVWQYIVQLSRKILRPY
ncbi:NIPSNAP family protein [Chloroflexota bacterium]